MKVLVVDDQRLSRAGIIKMIEWDRLGLQLAGECANGRETLDLLTNTDVDIVITDVRMPILGGLELIEQAKEQYPHISFIVISGYDDFAYVRKSIQLTVSDYLLKPVDQTEINTLLERLVEKTVAARQKLQTQLNKAREQFFYLLIESAYEQEELMLAEWEDIRLPEQKDCFIAAVFDSELDKHSLLAYLNEQIALNSIFLLRIRGSYVLIAAGTALEMSAHHDALRKALSNREYVQFTGLGKLVNGVDQLQQSFHSAYDAYTLQASVRPHLNRETASSAADSDASAKASIPLSAAWEREWFVVLKQGNRQAILGKLNELHTQLQATPVSDLVDSVYPYVLLRGVRELYEAKMLNEPSYIEALQITKKLPFIVGLEEKRAIVSDFLNRSLQAESAFQAHEMKEAIEKAKLYIDMNFHQTINLTDLAQTYYMSPGYFSSMFRQHSGRNFLEYLTHLRIEHAKHLLKQNPAAKISDVAIQCGYQDLKHFRNLFKRFTGVTPLKYKEEMQFDKENDNGLESGHSEQASQ